MPAGAECPGDMASPDNDMLIAALVVVGLLAVGLAVLLARRTREVRGVREIGERFGVHGRAAAMNQRRSVGSTVAVVDLKLLGFGVHDPIMIDAEARVELGLGVAVSLRRGRRKNLD